MLITIYLWARMSSNLVLSSELCDLANLSILEDSVILFFS